MEAFRKALSTGAVNGRRVLCAAAAVRDGVTTNGERDFDGSSIFWCSQWKFAVDIFFACTELHFTFARNRC